MSDYTVTRLSAAAAPDCGVTVPRRIVLETIRELRLRSDGWRESAGMWLGDQAGRVVKAVFHHQIADDRATALSLELPEAAKFKLYEQLSQDRLRIVSLIHTHPDSWVDLSWIDQQNQISSRIGFLSIVLPFYGQTDWHVELIGFHVKCERGWRRLTPPEVRSIVVVTDD